MNTPDNIPEFDASAMSVGELNHELLLRAIPLPCWIKIGRLRRKVTEENVREICGGLLMAQELSAINEKAKA